MGEKEYECVYCKGESVSRLRYWDFRLNKWAGRLMLLGSVLLVVGFGLVLNSFQPQYLWGDGFSNGSYSEGNFSSVEISNGMMVELSNGYNESVEKGYCLFGEINGSEVRVLDMDHVDNPSHQSRGSIRMDCLDEIWVRKGELGFRSGYIYLGKVHTHPDSSHRMSFRDVHTFGGNFFYERVAGVYDGGQLNFWGHAGVKPSDDLELRVVFREN